MESSQSASRNTLFQDLSRNSKGVTPVEGVKWEGVKKIGDFQQISRRVSDTVRGRIKDTNDH